MNLFVVSSLLVLVTIVTACNLEQSAPPEVQSSGNDQVSTFFLPAIWICSFFSSLKQKPADCSCNSPTEASTDVPTESPTEASTDVPAEYTDVKSRQTREPKLFDMIEGFKKDKFKKKDDDDKSSGDGKKSPGDDDGHKKDKHDDCHSKDDCEQPKCEKKCDECDDDCEGKSKGHHHRKMKKGCHKY